MALPSSKRSKRLYALPSSEQLLVAIESHFRVYRCRPTVGNLVLFFARAEQLSIHYRQLGRQLQRLVNAGLIRDYLDGPNGWGLSPRAARELGCTRTVLASVSVEVLRSARCPRCNGWHGDRGVCAWAVRVGTRVPTRHQTSP